MDLGIAGRVALVTASSKGLGRGAAEALAAEGVSIVLNVEDERLLAYRSNISTSVDTASVPQEPASTFGRS